MSSGCLHTPFLENQTICSFTKLIQGMEASLSRFLRIVKAFHFMCKGLCAKLILGYNQAPTKICLSTKCTTQRDHDTSYTNLLPFIIKCQKTSEKTCPKFMKNSVEFPLRKVNIICQNQVMKTWTCNSMSFLRKHWFHGGFEPMDSSCHLLWGQWIQVLNRL